MANPEKDADKKVEGNDREEVEDVDEEDAEDVDKEGEDSDSNSLDERLNPAPGFEEYNFPEDPEQWTAEDLGEVWINEKVSDPEDSADDTIYDTESSSENTDDVSTDISGFTTSEEEEEEEDEEGKVGGGRKEEEEDDDDWDDYTSDDEMPYLYSSDDNPSDPWLKFQKRVDPDGYKRTDLNEGFGWDPEMAGRKSKKVKRTGEIFDDDTDDDIYDDIEDDMEDDTEDDTEEEFLDDEEEDDETNYVPYNRTFPKVPLNWYEVSDEHEVVEELDRIEEALVWRSYVFDDGCTYEGTIWDDLAQGRGVFTTPMELCRYEGEWHQNMMEGHGVLEVDIPEEEPAPDDSELAEEMRKEGTILKADYMSPEDREWLIKDINDRMLKKVRNHAIYDNPEWIDYFEDMPETGHYRYAGQWKHGRMHGCGVYEVNRRTVWGRFYFGEMDSDTGECTAEISAMHASLAEVAAAKARMFVNKPDGMVRELKGPYSDPQHPYMYDEEDVWMAPGFINQFYEVPELWKRYVNDVDQERQMWLDSYYKSPLRIPMPAELEKWWWDDPEFFAMSDIKDPDREVLIHLPTNRLINWTEDPEGHVRLFWDESGENKPDSQFLPLGFDEFVGEEEKARMEEAKRKRALEEKVQATTRALQQELGKKKNEEEKRNRVDLEFQFLKVQEETEGLLDDVENQVDNKHEYEETVEINAQEKEPKDTPGPEDSEGGPSQDYEEEEEEDDEDEKPRSFGTVASAESQCNQRVSERKMDNHGPPRPPTLFASLSMVSTVAMQQLNPLTSWLKRKQHGSSKVDYPFMEGPGYAIRKQENSSGLALMDCPKVINYPLSRKRAVRLKARKLDQKFSCRNTRFSMPCTELGFSCHVSSNTQNCLSKPNESYGSKKYEGNEKREHKPSRKYSYRREKIALIFSLSVPVEELG